MAVCGFCDLAAEKLCLGCKKVYYCSKVCQASHWKDHKPTCTSFESKEKINCGSKIESDYMQIVTKVKDKKRPLSIPKKIESKDKCYRVVAIPGKGMGILAQRAIKYGELIMNEQPILRIKSKIANIHMFKDLLESQVNELLQLFHGGFINSYDMNGKTKILENIWKKYAFSLKNGIPFTDTGVFKDISRLNHSCTPNAERNFMDPGMRIFAIQDIEKDAEICIEYCGIETYEKQPTIQLVKSRLKLHWNFDCKCELCGDTDIKSRQSIENNRILYWELCRIAEMETIENDKERLATICEIIITQMSSAKYWSALDKMTYGFKGFQATLDILNMPLKEKKRKMKFFFTIIEEAVHIVQGVDGPNTVEKNDLERWKPICKAIDSMGENMYRVFTRFLLEENSLLTE